MSKRSHIESLYQRIIESAPYPSRFWAEKVQPLECSVSEILRGVDYVTDDLPSHLYLASLAAMLIACEKPIDEWWALTSRIQSVIEDGASFISTSLALDELAQLASFVVKRHLEYFSPEPSSPAEPNISNVLPTIIKSDELISVLLRGDSQVFNGVAVVRPLIQGWVQTPRLASAGAHLIASVANSWTHEMFRPSLYDDSMFCEQVSNLPLLSKHFKLSQNLLLEAYGPIHTEWLAMQIGYSK